MPLHPLPDGLGVAPEPGVHPPPFLCEIMTLRAPRISTLLLMIPIVILTLLLLVGCGTTDNADGETAYISQNDLDRVQEDAVRELHDSSGRMVNPDRKMQFIARTNSGGFGGFYFDDSDPSTVYVYMLDVTKTAEAERAFRVAMGESSEYTRIVPVRGRYSMDDLVDWFYQTLKALDSGGIKVNGAGLRPRDNGFSFMIGSNLDGAWDIIDGLDVRRDAVSLVIGEWKMLSDK